MNNIFSTVEQNIYDLSSKLRHYENSKKYYDDFIKDKNINVILNENNIRSMDSSIAKIRYNKSLGTTSSFLITRSTGGSFPRFLFKPNDKSLKGSDYKVKITLRWAGTPESYNFHSLNTKKWCLGLSDTLCRTTSANMPPINGEYVTYSVRGNSNQWNNINLEYIKWLSNSNIRYNKDNPFILEFKSIIFEFNSEYKIGLERDLNSQYNNIINLFNTINTDIQMLLNYDKININNNKDSWINLVNISNNLKKEYNNFLVNNYNAYNDFNAQSIDTSTLIKSNSLMYGGIILLNIIIISILFKQITK
jgi:hypothetical protein